MWSLCRLSGQVCSYEVVTSVLGILPNPSFVMKRFLETIHRELVQGLVLMEGITTIDYLKPTTHHLVHYSEFTPTHVTLTILRVMVFEGYNKYLKEHVRN